MNFLLLHFWILIFFFSSFSIEYEFLVIAFLFSHLYFLLLLYWVWISFYCISDFSFIFSRTFLLSMNFLLLQFWFLIYILSMNFVFYYAFLICILMVEDIRPRNASCKMHMLLSQLVCFALSPWPAFSFVALWFFSLTALWCDMGRYEEQWR